MTAKNEITLRVTITDEELIRRIRSISQPDRGRIIQRALKVYFDTVGGREVYELFTKKKTVAPGQQEEKLSQRMTSGKLKDVLGDY